MEAIMTIRQDLLGLTPEQLKDPAFFHGQSWSFLIDLFDTFQRYTQDQLAAIIHGFLGQWPHTANELDLALGAGACVEQTHYEALFHKPMSDKVKGTHREYFERLKLGEGRPNFIVEEERKKESKARHRDVGDDVAQKLRSMSIEEMLKWEEELGADAATLEKHRKIDQAGRQRMSVGNKIRYLLRKKSKN